MQGVWHPCFRAMYLERELCKVCPWTGAASGRLGVAASKVFTTSCLCRCTITCFFPQGRGCFNETKSCFGTLHTAQKRTASKMWFFSLSKPALFSRQSKCIKYSFLSCLKLGMWPGLPHWRWRNPQSVPMFLSLFVFPTNMESKLGCERTFNPEAVHQLYLFN